MNVERPFQVHFVEHRVGDRTGLGHSYSALLETEHSYPVSCLVLEDGFPWVLKKVDHKDLALIVVAAAVEKKLH